MRSWNDSRSQAPPFLLFLPPARYPVLCDILLTWKEMKWLLILDNLENASLLETFIPVNLSGRSVIATTEHAQISPVTKDFQKLELQHLETEFGSLLFFRILGPPLDG